MNEFLDTNSTGAKSWIKKFLLALLVLSLLIVSTIIVSNVRFDEKIYFQNILNSIESTCYIEESDEIVAETGEFYSNFYYKNHCINEKIATAIDKVDPKSAAQMVFAVYQDPEFPLVTNSCHSIVHTFGRHAADINTGVDIFDKNLELCSSGFLNGYYEKHMEELNNADFAEKGFTDCAISAQYKGGMQDCAHTYGHFVYSRNNSELVKAPSYAELCLDIPKEAVSTCLNGFFMEMFSDRVYGKVVMTKPVNSSINNLLQDCLNYDFFEIKESCVLMSWYAVYNFFEAYKEDGKSAKETAFHKCVDIDKDLTHACGMMLGFMSFSLAEGSRETIIKDCEFVRTISEEAADGCFLWSARTLWRQTYDDSDFNLICGRVSPARQSSCDEMWIFLTETNLINYSKSNT